MSAEGVPNNCEHAEGGGEDTARHRADTLGPPAEDLLEGSECPAGEVEDLAARVAGGVTGDGDVERLALVGQVRGHRVALLGLDWSLDERHGETGFQVPLNVTCKRGQRGEKDWV